MANPKTVSARLRWLGKHFRPLVNHTHPTYISTLILASWALPKMLELRGRVMDGDWSSLADARIVVSELERTTQSGSDGNWVLNGAPGGVHGCLQGRPI